MNKRNLTNLFLASVSYRYPQDVQQKVAIDSTFNLFTEGLEIKILTIIN